MRYIIIITTADGRQTINHIDAQDARTAHEHGAAIAQDASATIRVYPATQDEHGATIAAGIARGALMVARRTAANAVRRTGGNETQCRIDKELTAANARCHGAETAARIIEVISSYSADTQDFFGYAAQGITDGIAAGLDIAEQYHGAFIALNKFVHSQHSATEHELSTEFIIDGGGDIVAINTAISTIIRGGDKWTPTDGGGMDAETAARLGAAIAAAMRTVTPTQRKIAELTGRGYSQRQIAEKTGRAVVTVEKNLVNVRAKIAAYIRENAPEFAHMIDNAETAAAVERWANGGRTVEGAKRKAAADKATQAERAKRYRMRKTLECKWREWANSVDMSVYVNDVDGTMGVPMIQDFSNYVGVDLLDGEKGVILFDIALQWERDVEKACATCIKTERAWDKRGEKDKEHSVEWDKYNKYVEWIIANMHIYGGADSIERIARVTAAKLH